MSLASRSRILWFLWPAVFVAAAVAVYAFHGLFFQRFAPEADPTAVRHLAAAAAYFSGAWLLSRITGKALGRVGDGGRRKAPKLLRELITAALFTAATIATVAMLLGQSAGGALASSGLIIAILGFAIRNVLADVLSGIALGIEAPYRIGDWIDIDGSIRGRVIEIGWRTTRLLTRDDTYMILPNSQISRQKLTNYSAPRKHYRAQLQVILSHEISIAQAKELLTVAAASTDLIMKSPKPDARAVSYDPDGVRYAVRYWVPNFADEVDCRDAVLLAIDEAIRKQELPPPFSRIKLLPSDMRESTPPEKHEELPSRSASQGLAGHR